MRGPGPDDLPRVKGVLWGDWPSEAQAVAIATKKRGGSPWDEMMTNPPGKIPPR